MKPLLNSIVVLAALVFCIPLGIACAEKSTEPDKPLCPDTKPEKKCKCDLLCKCGGKCDCDGKECDAKKCKCCEAKVLLTGNLVVKITTKTHVSLDGKELEFTTADDLTTALDLDIVKVKKVVLNEDGTCECIEFYTPKVK